MLFLDKYCDTLRYSTKGEIRLRENALQILMRAWSGEYKMPIAFDRSVCCDLKETISREWLVSNGLGGYAAGTVAGVLTRMQHGLLVASPLESAVPQLLLAKIDEEVAFDQRTYYLGTNEYRDGALNPAGFVHLETFRLEEGFPVFTYRLGGINGIVLEKRIWMPHGLNTTCIQYRVLRTAPTPTIEQTWSDERGLKDAPDGRKVTSLHQGPTRREYTYGQSLERSSSRGVINHARTDMMNDAIGAQQMLNLTLLPFAAYRAHHQPQYGNNDWHFQVDVHHQDEQGEPALPRGVAGCTIRAWDGAHPYHIFAVGHPESQTTFIPTGVWYWSFLRRHDQAAGLPPTDDLYLPGVIRTKLWPGEDTTLTIIVTAEELSSQTFNPCQLDLSYKRSVELQRDLCTQRYFGEGGETLQQMRVLPFAMISSTGGMSAGEELKGAAPGDHKGRPYMSIHPAPTEAYAQGEEYLRLLVQAGDRFLAQHSLPHREGQFSFLNDTDAVPFVPATYYDMQESIRETLIALPGLTLTTNRYDEARRLLRILARHFRQGMLPDRLPAPGRPLDENDYGSVDTTLWFFYALDHYLRVTHDYELLDELYQRLVGCINWYKQGTGQAQGPHVLAISPLAPTSHAPGKLARNGIQIDANDGLLQAQQAGKALTWMNATVNNVPVTPRAGKPVEVNALWYHALSLMDEWSQQLYSMRRINYTTSAYQEQCVQCKESFLQRFWYANGGYLYDVIDGPDGDDTSFRPNQLLALSLRYPVLDEERQRTILDLVTQRLLTPYGLRTLAPHEAGYVGQLKGNQEERLRALHQGSVWPWLLGPYIDAWLRLEESPSIKLVHDASQQGATTHDRDEGQKRAQRVRQKGFEVLEPFRKHLTEEMLGMIGGAFSGDAPYESGYAFASALSSGENLRIYSLFAQIDVEQRARNFSSAVHSF